MSWDERWMDMARFVAGWSKDRSRKCGCVIVDSRQVLVSVGWNGFPRGIYDDVDERHKRPAKYQWTEHAERNAIYNAAAKGVGLHGCTLYVVWSPCSDCARGIIQAGVARLVCNGYDENDPKWGNDMKLGMEMLREAGVTVSFLPGDAVRASRTY